MSDDSVRIANITGVGVATPREIHCDWCCNEGWVVVDAGTPADQIEDLHRIWRERRREFTARTRRQPQLRDVLKLHNEQVKEPSYGPCPFCEAGFANEFPAHDKGGREIVPKWGRNGFWRGRSPLVEKTCTCYAKSIPLEQVIEGMRQMAGIIGRDVPDAEMVFPTECGFDDACLEPPTAVCPGCRIGCCNTHSYGERWQRHAAECEALKGAAA